MIVEKSNKAKGGAIRISIPVKVAYNADAFQKSIRNLLDELGCRTCFSGVDCYFSTIRDYMVDPQKNELLQLNAQQMGSFSAPSPEKMAEPRALRVGLSPASAYNIKSIDVAIKNIFKEIGCLACCSGHDIYFQNQFDFHF